MAHSKDRIESQATQIVSWLVEHQVEFEKEGISEESLARSLGLPNTEDIAAAVDRLENTEVVVRVPKPLTSPTRLLLEPGRMWNETRDGIVEAKSVGGTK